MPDNYQVYGASHMVGFDVPHVAHDMMLRFMGVDFTALLTGSALFPSEVGDAVKPIIKPALGNSSKDDNVSPEEDDPTRWQGIDTWHTSQRRIADLPFSIL